MFRALSRTAKANEKRLKTQISELKSEVDGLKTENEEFQEELKDLKKKNEELKDEKENLEMKKKKLEGENDRLQKLRNEYKDHITKFESAELNGARDELDDVKTELIKMVKERDDAVSQLTKIAKERDNAVAQVVDLSHPKHPKPAEQKLPHDANLEATMVKHTMRIARLEKNKHEFEAKISELESEKYEASEKITELATDNNRLRDEKLVLVNEDTRLKSENKHLKNGYEGLQDLNRQLKAEIGRLKNENAQLTMINTDNSNGMDGVKDAMSKDDTIKELKHEKLQLVDRNDELKDELNRCKLEYERGMKEMDRKLAEQREQLIKVESKKEELMKADVEHKDGYEEELGRLREENEKLLLIRLENEEIYQEDPVKLIKDMMRKQAAMEERLQQLEAYKLNDITPILTDISDHSQQLAVQESPMEINSCDCAADRAKLTGVIATVFPKTVNELGFFCRITVRIPPLSGSRQG